MGEWAYICSSVSVSVHVADHGIFVQVQSYGEGGHWIKENTRDIELLWLSCQEVLAERQA